jgi:hypothetical protein
MGYLMSVRADYGTDDNIVFEVDGDQIPDDLVLASPRLSGTAAHASFTLTEALGKLKPSLERTVSLLHELSPQRIDVEFGLKIGGETGIIVSKGTVEANFTVHMSWDRTSHPRAPDAVPAAS